MRTVDLGDTLHTSDTDGGATSLNQNFEALNRQPVLPADRSATTSQSGLPLYLDHGQPSQISTSFRRRAYFLTKRAVDVVIAAGALLLLSPALLTITLAIVLSTRGTALFRQPRMGFGGRQFTIFKFRTMYADRTDIGGSRQASHDDDRITPIGRVLRRGSLDELPQLLNIIRGDMSLVGPRPYPLDMTIDGKKYEEIAPYYAMRFSVPPGLTGWAQANGLRGATDDVDDAKVRLDHDIAYIQHASLWLDLKILWRTAWRELAGRGTGV